MADNNSDNGTPGTAYIPGEYYDATRGFTLPQFESITGVAKSIPAEMGFLAHPDAIARAIIVSNLSGCDLTVVCDRNKRINKHLPKARENERELNGFFLPHGSSSHFNVPPFCYHVNVSEYVLSENGGKKWLSLEGFLLTDIQNQIISYQDGEAQGLVSATTNSANLDNFAWIRNYSTSTIKVKVTKSATAYPTSREEINNSKSNREPDQGGEVVEENVIKPGGVWHFKTPPREYTIRALEPPSVEFGNDSIMGEDTRVPPETDYVQLAESNAMANQTVVFLQGIKRDGAVIGKTYFSSEIKLVNSDIVRNDRIGHM